MDNPKTMEELIKGMDDLAMNLDWKPDEFNAVLYFTHDNGGTSYNMFGNGAAMVNALLMIMINDERFRKVMCATHEAYINYMAKKTSPVLESIIKTIDKVQKEMMNCSVNAKQVPCLFSDSFKPKS